MNSANGFHILIFFFCLSHIINLSDGAKCINTEREALLAFKAGHKDPSHSLASWIGEECCKWSGVKCNRQTGHVTEISLSSNSLAGELPESLGVFKNLQILDLSTNGFRGKIPSSIGSLSSLTKLDLSNNNMDGQIPESFGLLSKLVDVNLLGNNWEGVLKEAHLRNLKSLKSLSLTTDSNKPLIFDVSSSWDPPFRLKLVQIKNCRIGPLFPKWLQFQTELETVTLNDVGISDIIPEKWLSQISPTVYMLNLSNNQFRGKLPPQLNAPNLRLVYLDSNRFEGPLPLWSSVAQLYLDNNHFSGSIPENIAKLMPRLEMFFASWNDLTGKIPSSMCDIEGLQVISLRNNRISGELPDCWHHPMFWGIDVSNNSLTGKIPTSFGSLSSLAVFLLSDNKLVGEIPSSFQNCSSLTSIDLKGNRISGSLSPWIGEKLYSLFMLNLGSNLITGTIPQQFCIPRNLHILDLSYNKISGEIPKCLGNLKGFINRDNIDAFENYLFTATRGRNPEYSNYIANVNSINLSGNSLRGGIPEEMTKLVYLRKLDPSHNRLSGQIPEGLGDLNSLFKMDLSYNILEGRNTWRLKFNDTSIYEGNPSLCGPPLSKKCLA